MRFSGYWVSAERDKLEVTAGEFDETDLSNHSDWREAWQNEDTDHPHGFLDPLTMLHDISKKILGEIDAAELQKAVAELQAGTPYPIDGLRDLALLIRLVIPKALPSQSARKTSLTDDYDIEDEITSI